MLKIENITLKYEDKTVIDGLSYNFAEGVVTAITGASGSGKTTLLYLLSGLKKAQKGTVYNDHKRIAAVFQEHRLFPWLSAIDNITVTGADISRAKELLNILFPDETVDEKYPDELSGGMKQRIAIARALAYDPDILLLDEPFKGLDKETKTIVTNTVFDVIKGKTCILITHDEDDLVYCQEHLRISENPITKFDLVKSSNI
jgi:ABC-type nitrate/sulfonate/bicarbonate transport system ATPase subunit